MENTRETKTFTTGGGNKIVHYTYITGRETNQIQEVYLKDTKVNMVGSEIKVEGFNTGAQHEATKKTIEMMVVSVNGKTEKVVDDVLDLPDSEYQEVVEELNSINSKKKLH